MFLSKGRLLKRKAEMSPVVPVTGAVTPLIYLWKLCFLIRRALFTVDLNLLESHVASQIPVFQQAGGQMGCYPQYFILPSYWLAMLSLRELIWKGCKPHPHKKGLLRETFVPYVANSSVQEYPSPTPPPQTCSRDERQILLGLADVPWRCTYLP